jgi:hypothetical protein
MPQKDKSETNRDRKKDNRGNGKDGVYSAKHVRILEGRQLQCHTNQVNQSSEKQNKKSNKSNKN